MTKNNTQFDLESVSTHDANVAHKNILIVNTILIF